ncbi:FAD binding domain-containing protein [Mycena vulgaris]|nr:FAD binding domain-containing protein [Mycena vulgaris]
MTVNTPSYTDVLIIGAGPGGLMAAQALAKLGIQVKIIDRRSELDKYGNADGLMSRTLEIWKGYGLYEKIAPRACPVHVMAGYERCGEGIVRSEPCINVVVPARYQYDFGVAPEIIEAVLRESLEETGHHVSQRLTPVHIDREVSTVADNEFVKLQVILQRVPADSNGPKSVSLNGHTDDTETVFAKYVIGADGAHSWVRRHLNIPMEGDQTEYFWGAADVAIETNFPDFRTKCVIQSATGAVIIIPREDDKVRIYVGFSPNEATRDADGRLSIPIEVASNMVLEATRVGLKPYILDFKQVFWCTVFTVSQMVAARYSADDRIFLIGDAVHTHSPKAGQGANAAIGDAHNLAWKIAHVLRNWARPSLLHTYEIERRRYAQDLIAFDKVIAESLDGGTAADYQNKTCLQGFSFGNHILSFADSLSGIGIHYNSSLIIDSSLPKGTTLLEAGYRLPPVGLDRLADWRPQELQDLAPSDGLFKLFLFPGDLLCEKDAGRLDVFCHALSTPSTCGRAAWDSGPAVHDPQQREGEGYVEWCARHLARLETVQSPVFRFAGSINNVPCRVFVTTSCDNAYTKFGVSVDGACILVR